MITQEKLKEFLVYNEDDGVFIRKKSSGNVKRGSLAGSVTSHGYLAIRVGGNLYKAHRLAWLYVYGYFPENQIDHMNRNRVDNRICNLREVSRSCNIRNSRKRVDNKSGVKGVSWHKASDGWVSQIVLNGRKIHLGTFNDLTEAVAHRLAFEQCIDWHNCDSSSPAYKYMKEFVSKDNG